VAGVAPDNCCQELLARAASEREWLPVLGDLEEKDADAEAAQQQLAAFALAEINRIISDLSEPV